MKYVNCDYCDEKIYEGDICYNDITCGIYCSADCFVRAKFNTPRKILNSDLVEDCCTEFKEE